MGICLSIPYFPVYSQELDSARIDPFKENWEDEYLLYEGKVIGRIHINVIEISGDPIDSEEGHDTSWFHNIANTIHVKTREWVVRDWLLFSEGDRFEAKLITESERLLRSTGAFVDARISVIEDKQDTVDILVSAKDRWTLSVNLSYSNVNESYFGIKDDNMLGLGHGIDATVTHNNDKNIGTGLKGSYIVHNIAGSYINGGVYLQTNKKFNIQSVNLSRPFLSTELDWAGGVGFSKESNKFLYLNDQEILFLPYKVQSYDLWIGRSFPIWFGETSFRNKTRLIISGRANTVVHTEKPEEIYGVQELFTNSTLYLIKGGIINRRYYKDYYIEGFGHTEDVPVGGILALTAGTEKRGTDSRIYSAVKGVLSKRIEDFGYASIHIELGGFKSGDRLEQTVYNFNFLYHSPLFINDEWMQRLFLRGDYLLGFRRFQGEQIYLNDKSGIRGMDGITVFGSKRAVINIEDRIFSPYSILGFILGANVFIDLGLISGEKQSLTQSRLYQGYGALLRVSNESIARAQFEIGMVFNPFLPSKSYGSVSLVLSASFLIGIRNFEFLRPYIISFKDN